MNNEGLITRFSLVITLISLRPISVDYLKQNVFIRLLADRPINFLLISIRITGMDREILILGRDFVD